ncbi:MAG: adenylate/guanylate cyclase domain-containing protein, partial [Vicinamibacterales bacterium]
SDRPRFMDAESLWGRSVRSGASSFLATRLSDDDTLRELSHIAVFAGGLTVPLAYQDELFGTINVYTADSGPEIDASVLASIGAVLYGAIKRQAFVSVLTRIRGTLERYLPAELVETVINAPETLATRTTIDRVTVLFSDIRDFTALAEHASPDMISELLSDHLSEMAEGVLGHQGMVDKYLGDAVMAVFGAPFPQPDHASRAFCAALEMQQRQAALSARWESRLGRKIEVGIGIHTGPVAMGNVGHERHREYAVTGDTVNVASRLKDLARAGEILVSTSALDAAGAAFTAGPPDTLTVRGRSEPVLVHVLRRIGDVTDEGNPCVTARSPILAAVTVPQLDRAFNSFARALLCMLRLTRQAGIARCNPCCRKN